MSKRKQCLGTIHYFNGHEPFDCQKCMCKKYTYGGLRDALAAEKAASEKKQEAVPS